jgi:hypothetical protein
MPIPLSPFFVAHLSIPVAICFGLASPLPSPI